MITGDIYTAQVAASVRTKKGKLNGGNFSIIRTLHKEAEWRVPGKSKEAANLIY